MTKPIIFFSVVFTFLGCNPAGSGKQTIEQCKQEIIRTEKDFEAMAAEKGLPVAFAYFAADSAVLNVLDTLIRGRESIRAYYAGWKVSDVSLRWSPDYVDVAASCDLAYTYGRYNFSFRDSTGMVSESTGIFHTVWKKQPDGSWKFVWD